jgi:hypothetical protein
VTFFRNILHDLVEKRLWPVALLLCAALVAVPTLLKEDPAAPSAASTGPSTATLAEASVTETDNPARSRLDIGKERNPFQTNTPATTKTTPSTTTTTPDTTTPSAPSTSSGSSGGGSSGGGGGGGTGGGGVTPTPTPVPTPPAPGEQAWTLDVKFGTDGDTKAIKALIPGRALPSSTDPVLIYLSATDDGKEAQFLVSSDARPQGDGKCTPSEKTCTVITLKKGDTTFFDVAKDDGTTQYELELVNIVKRTVE